MRTGDGARVEPAFWSGRRVLVTGHTGFKGSWLSLWLQSMGAEVAGLSLDVPTEPSLFGALGPADGMRDERGDVRDHERLAALVADHRPEVVLHMAAQPLVRLSFEDPRTTYETNVMGTVNVLEAVRRAGGVRVAIVVTSDKCYDNREWEWGYRENEPMGGHDPYSNSKGCAELVTDAYRRSFFSGEQSETRVASARAGNVIGGGDWAADRIIPDLMRAALSGEAVRVRNPEAIRPWQHVLCPLSGYLVLAQALWQDPGLATGWNFGPAEEEARPVGWIVGRVQELWGGGLESRVDPGPHPHEAHYLKLDSSRARMRLGWRPRWELGRALEATVEWFRAFERGAAMREITLEQISAYESTV